MPATPIFPNPGLCGSDRLAFLRRRAYFRMTIFFLFLQGGVKKRKSGYFPYFVYLAFRSLIHLSLASRVPRFLELAFIPFSWSAITSFTGDGGRTYEGSGSLRDFLRADRCLLLPRLPLPSFRVLRKVCHLTTFSLFVAMVLFFEYGFR